MAKIHEIGIQDEMFRIFFSMHGQYSGGGISYENVKM